MPLHTNLTPFELRGADKEGYVRNYILKPYRAESAEVIRDVLEENHRLVQAGTLTQAESYDVITIRDRFNPFLGDVDSKRIQELALAANPPPEAIFFSHCRGPLRVNPKNVESYIGASYPDPPEAGNIVKYVYQPHTRSYVQSGMRGVFFVYRQGLTAEQQPTTAALPADAETSLFLLGPYERSRWDRACLWRSGAVLDMFSIAEDIQQIELTADISGTREKFRVNKVVETSDEVKYQLSFVNHVSSSLSSDAFATYIKDKSYRDAVNNILKQGVDVKYTIIYFPADKGKNPGRLSVEGKVVEGDIYDTLSAGSNRMLDIEAPKGKNDEWLDGLSVKDAILNKARIFFSQVEGHNNISLTDIFFYLTGSLQSSFPDIVTNITESLPGRSAGLQIQGDIIN